MSNLYYEDFFEGMDDTLKKKANEHLFTSPNNASLFPNLTSQAKWKYAKGANFLRLHDGQKVYSFSVPSGFSHTEEFAATREADGEHSKFEEGAETKGLAQVHRADPGSIYFTLQEGRENPTYTFKHTGESNWRGVPKKRKAKEVVMPNVDIPTVADGIKAAFAASTDDAQAAYEKLAEREVTAALRPLAERLARQKERRNPDGILGKKADFSPFKWAAGPGAHALQRGLFSPGELAFRAGGNGEHPILGALASGGVGAGLGAAYHYGKRNLYNTDEENAQEDEQGVKPLLKRMLIPGAGLGLLGGIQSSVFKPQYQDIVSGAGMRSKGW